MAAVSSSERNKAFYAANREREKARASTWRRENRDQVKKTTAAWREANKERRAETNRAWLLANKDRRAEYRRIKYAENRDRELALGRAYKTQHKDVLANKAAEYLREHPERNRHFRSMRRASEKRATPAWANKKKIRAIYKQASVLSIETGIQHHVDHIYPLKSKWMCGLHVETNLQILPAAENQAKSNRRWPDMAAEMRV